MHTNKQQKDNKKKMYIKQTKMENAYKIAQIDILDPPKNENAY